jgi:hypothetical protein
MGIKKLVPAIKGIITNLRIIVEVIGDLDPTGSTGTQSNTRPKPKAPKPAKPKEGAKRPYTRKPRADGKPRIQDAIVSVMGSNEMDAPSIFAGLKARNWVPATNNPKGYISFVLSSSGLFERTRRGFYRVKGTETSKF